MNNISIEVFRNNVEIIGGLFKILGDIIIPPKLKTVELSELDEKTEIKDDDNILIFFNPMFKYCDLPLIDLPTFPLINTNTPTTLLNGFELKDDKIIFNPTLDHAIYYLSNKILFHYFYNNNKFVIDYDTTTKSKNIFDEKTCLIIHRKNLIIEYLNYGYSKNYKKFIEIYEEEGMFNFINTNGLDVMVLEWERFLAMDLPEEIYETVKIIRFNDKYNQQTEYFKKFVNVEIITATDTFSENINEFPKLKIIACDNPMRWTLTANLRNVQLERLNIENSGLIALPKDLNIEDRGIRCKGLKRIPRFSHTLKSKLPSKAPINRVNHEYNINDIPDFYNDVQKPQSKFFYDIYNESKNDDGYDYLPINAEVMNFNVDELEFLNVKEDAKTIEYSTDFKTDTEALMSSVENLVLFYLSKYEILSLIVKWLNDDFKMNRIMYDFLKHRYETYEEFIAYKRLKKVIIPILFRHFITTNKLSIVIKFFSNFEMEKLQEYGNEFIFVADYYEIEFNEDFPNLKILYYYNPTVNNPIPQKIANNILGLYFSEEYKTDLKSDVFKPFNNLKILHLESTMFYHRFDYSVLSKLKFFSSKISNLITYLPHTLQGLSDEVINDVDFDKFVNLSVLKLSQPSNMSLTIPKNLQQLEWITNVEIKNVFIDTSVRILKLEGKFDNLKLHTQLEELTIVNKGYFNFDFTNLKNLKKLTLKKLKISKLETIVSLSKLTELILDNCYIDYLPCNIGELTNLKSISITNNNLMEIPESLFSIKSLMHLDFNHNFIQAIPPAIRLLTNLTSINFSHNNLNTIPVSIGTMTYLNTLLLDYNDILVLPESFCNLTSLQQVSLTNNTHFSVLPKNIENLIDTVIMCEDTRLMFSAIMRNVSPLSHVIQEHRQVEEVFIEPVFEEPEFNDDEDIEDSDEEDGVNPFVALPNVHDTSGDNTLEPLNRLINRNRALNINIVARNRDIDMRYRIEIARLRIEENAEIRREIDTVRNLLHYINHLNMRVYVPEQTLDNIILLSNRRLNYLIDRINSNIRELLRLEEYNADREPPLIEEDFTHIPLLGQLIALIMRIPPIINRVHPLHEHTIILTLHTYTDVFAHSLTVLTFENSQPARMIHRFLRSILYSNTLERWNTTRREFSTSNIPNDQIQHYIRDYLNAYNRPLQNSLFEEIDRFYADRNERINERRPANNNFQQLNAEVDNLRIRLNTLRVGTVEHNDLELRIRAVVAEVIALRARGLR